MVAFLFFGIADDQLMGQLGEIGRIIHPVPSFSPPYEKITEDEMDLDMHCHHAYSFLEPKERAVIVANGFGFFYGIRFQQLFESQTVGLVVTNPANPTILYTDWYLKKWADWVDWVSSVGWDKIAGVQDRERYIGHRLYSQLDTVSIRVSRPCILLLSDAEDEKFSWVQDWKQNNTNPRRTSIFSESRIYLFVVRIIKRYVGILKITPNKFSIDGKNISRAKYLQLAMVNERNFITRDRLILFPRVFLIGMGGVGKTTIRNMLKEKGYTVISLDQFIDEFSLVHPSGKQVFSVYSNKKRFPQLAQRIVDHIIEQLSLHKRLVVEGAVFNHTILKQLAPYFQFIYVEPSSVDQYKANMLKRFNQDIKNGTRTMSIVWKTMEWDKNDNYQQIIDQLATFRMGQLIIDYDFFQPYNIMIYEN